MPNDESKLKLKYEITLKKFDGDIEEGKEPVETIQFEGIDEVTQVEWEQTKQEVENGTH